MQYYLANPHTMLARQYGPPRLSSFQLRIPPAMSDFVEWNPKRHGQQPPYWGPGMPTSVDGLNFSHQPNWAWISGTTYYVPREAVELPRVEPEPADRLISLKAVVEAAEAVTNAYAQDECGQAIVAALKALEKQP
jgi:hypothetical protein